MAQERGDHGAYTKNSSSNSRCHRLERLRGHRAAVGERGQPGVNDGGVYPSAVPASFTPNIASGAVEAIVQVGSRIVVGGSFSSTVTPKAGAGAGKAVTRKYLFAFNASTGALDTGFVPSVNGEVDSIVPSADGTAVYVGGKFTSAGGVSTRLAEFSLANGARITSFSPSLNGQIRDMALLNGRLLLAGTFTVVKSVAHGGLASVNATTGAVDPYLSINVSGHHNYGRVANAAQAPVAASQIAVSPDHSRAIVDGNFNTVKDSAGTYSRDQIMSINLGASSATVDANWKSNTYTSACFANAYDDYVRDVGWSPDGSYFVVSATGGYNGGSFQNCDTATRFNASSSGQAVTPAWVDWTGTDSLYSVAVTSDAVFVGGHQRWLNNPYGQDAAKNGAVPRPGLAALDPANGVPLSWNPGRTPRGHGAEVIYASASGLWVGSDTDFIGPNQYKRQKLAFFPFTGGTPATGDNTGDAHTVFLAGAAGNSLHCQHFRPLHRSRRPDLEPRVGGGIAWGSITGGFVLNGRIWYADRREVLLPNLGRGQRVRGRSTGRPVRRSHLGSLPDRLRPDLPVGTDQLLCRVAEGDRHVLRQPLDLLHGVGQQEPVQAGVFARTRALPQSRAR